MKRWYVVCEEIVGGVKTAKAVDVTAKLKAAKGGDAAIAAVKAAAKKMK